MMSSESQPPKPWEPIRSFSDKSRDILDLAWIAASTLELIAKGTFAPPAEPSDHADLRAFALKQYEQQYPLVIEQALVSLWGCIETTVEQVSTLWLQRHPGMLGEKPFAKLRVRVAEILSLEESERTRLLIEELDRSLADCVPAGIDRFEAVLKAIGLNGDLDPGVRRALVELYQIRNIYVHRGGLADRHFRRVCPWRSESVGEPIRVLPEHIYAYSTVVTSYAHALHDRVFRGLGGIQGETPPDVLKYPDAVPGAQVVRMTREGPSCTFVFETTDAAAKVLDYYRATLADWTKHAGESSDADGFLHYTSPDGKQSAVISAKAGMNGLTELGILHIIHSTGSLGDGPDAEPRPTDTGH
jgi:hypothetical protein